MTDIIAGATPRGLTGRGGGGFSYGMCWGRRRRPKHLSTPRGEESSILRRADPFALGSVQRCQMRKLRELYPGAGPQLRAQQVGAIRGALREMVQRSRLAVPRAGRRRIPIAVAHGEGLRGVRASAAVQAAEPVGALRFGTTGAW